MCVGYASAEVLFENEQCDMLSIVTNTPSHADLTTAAMEAGVGVILCEKTDGTQSRRREADG